MQKKTNFGALEGAIMEIIWRQGSATVRTVLDALQGKRPVAYTTVMTVMNRLVERKCLTRRPSDRGAFTYVPTATRDELAASAARQSFEQLIHQYGDAALVQFLDQLDRIPDHKLQQLRRRLRKHRP